MSIDFGTSNTTRYYSVPDHADFTLPDADWTWLALVRHESPGTISNYAISTGDWGTSNSFNLYTYGTNFGASVRVGTIAEATGIAALTVGTWYWIFARRAGTALDCGQIALNAAATTEAAAVAITGSQDSTTGPQIGRRAAGLVRNWNGQIGQAAFVSGSAVTSPQLVELASGTPLLSMPFAPSIKFLLHGRNANDASITDIIGGKVATKQGTSYGSNESDIQTPYTLSVNYIRGASTVNFLDADLSSTGLGTTSLINQYLGFSALNSSGTNTNNVISSSYNNTDLSPAGSGNVTGINSYAVATSGANIGTATNNFSNDYLTGTVLTSDGTSTPNIQNIYQINSIFNSSGITNLTIDPDGSISYIEADLTSTGIGSFNIPIVSINTTTGSMSGVGTPDIQVSNLFNSYIRDSIFSVDQFTDSDGVEIQVHNPKWSSGIINSKMVIIGNRVRNDITATSIFIHNDLPNSTNYSVSSDIFWASLSGVPGIIGRASTTEITHYMAQLTSTEVKLFKVVLGTATQLNSTSFISVVGNTYALKLKMVGDLIQVFIDGSLMLSTNDSAITGPGYSGIRYFSSVAPSDITGGHLDNFQSNDELQNDVVFNGATIFTANLNSVSVSGDSFVDSYYSTTNLSSSAITTLSLVSGYTFDSVLGVVGSAAVSFFPDGSIAYIDADMSSSGTGSYSPIVNCISDTILNSNGSSSVVVIDNFSYDVSVSSVGSGQTNIQNTYNIDSILDSIGISAGSIESQQITDTVLNGSGNGTFIIFEGQDGGQIIINVDLISSGTSLLNINAGILFNARLNSSGGSAVGIDDVIFNNQSFNSSGTSITDFVRQYTILQINRKYVSTMEGRRYISVVQPGSHTSIAR